MPVPTTSDANVPGMNVIIKKTSPTVITASVPCKNEKNGFGRKNKEWQDESITLKWMLMGLY